METKTLVWDTCGIDPISYSLKEKKLQMQELQRFYYGSGISVITSYECASKEFTYQHNNQQNIFVESITKNSFTTGNDNDTIYLASSGDFSQTSFKNDILVNVIYPQTTMGLAFDASTLWKYTQQWNNEMSEEDKSLIKIAKEKKNNNLAILTNNYHLREQCEFEGIRTFGTCSMLAGMVISSNISYQRGTFIFKSWLEKDRKWIPNKNMKREKLSFKEVLGIEKRRSRDNNSFWIN